MADVVISNSVSGYVACEQCGGPQRERESRECRERERVESESESESESERERERERERQEHEELVPLRFGHHSDTLHKTLDVWASNCYDVEWMLAG